ncbi:MAG: hypothetical protein Q9163_002673 [Psora crenata]
MPQQHICSQDVLSKFDAAVSQSYILWTPTSPIHLIDNGFQTLLKFSLLSTQFQFRLCPQFLQKPQLLSGDTERDGSSEKHPIEQANPPPQSDIDNPPHIYHIATLPPDHSLLLNKYCVFRPQYLLLTDSPSRRQCEPLEETDLRAAWTALGLLEGEHIAIYNCGQKAGSSRTHKHLQIFPRPADFTLFPDRRPNETTNVPYVYDIIRFEDVDPTTAGWERIVDEYTACLRRARTGLGIHEGKDVPHNVVLVKGWMVVIPRRKARLGAASANAAGMMGMVWVKTEEELEEWKRHGPSHCLGEFGVRDSCPQRGEGTSRPVSSAR